MDKSVFDRHHIQFDTEAKTQKEAFHVIAHAAYEAGFVKNENAVVTSLVDREQVGKYECEILIEKSFGGSLPAFLNAFLKDRKLSRREAEAIYRLVEQALPEEEQDKGKET